MSDAKEIFDGPFLPGEHGKLGHLLEEEGGNCLVLLDGADRIPQHGLGPADFEKMDLAIAEGRTKRVRYDAGQQAFVVVEKEIIN